MNRNLRKRFDEAVELKRNGQFSLAKEILEDLVKIDTGTAAIFAVLGNVCWEMRLLHEAATAFKTATKLSPKSEAASLGLFHVLLEMERQAEALEEAQRFLEVAYSETYIEIIDTNYKSVARRSRMR